MKKKGELKFEMPAQGWSQFLTARKEMLDSYDKARTHSKKHKVQTSHGNVAEAEFRKWLSDFLPKRYAVTSGYIISAGVSDFEKLPHFDVIIYEHLDSPILWIEDSPDKSEQGRSIAIPAEYVKAVIEVKSAFSNRTVKDAIEHLRELKKLMSGIDASDERYKMYLPPDFFCSLLFFELRKKNEFDTSAMDTIVRACDLRGFCGGFVLRGEGLPELDTGKIELLRAENQSESKSSERKMSLLKAYFNSHSLKLTENLHLGSLLFWGETYFSGYAFDLVARLNGTYEVGRISSFHALGTSGWAKTKGKD